MSSEKKPTIEIETLQPSEVAEASVLLSQAYSVSPLFSVILGGSIEKQRSMLETSFKMTLKSGIIFSANEGGKILGVMRVLEWPQCQKEYRRFQGLNLLPLLLILRGGALRGRKWLSIWAKHDPNEPHSHLNAFGVLPERQGQGIGSLLLSHFCEYVDNIGQAAYLETDVQRNIHLYERFGFKVVGETSVFFLPNWFMWRDAMSVKER
jgi:ribosomal protein S18 acetylase RimI-like enzyme